MDIIFLLTVLQMSSFNEAYNFTCPSQPHWNIRAQTMCKPLRNYTCLFDVTFRVNIYRERCRRPRILAPGYKYVFQPDLNRATCSRTRYQPFIFDTIGNSDCTYQKSLCNSLGQETYERGNARSDRKCICNTDGGYSFVENSLNQCYCNPSIEDCSCYLGINPNNRTVGQKDIQCYDDMTMYIDLHRKDILNVSGTEQIIEFDNYKYNLNYIPSTVVCIILVINRRRLKRFIQFHSKIKPKEIEAFARDQKSVKTNLPVSGHLRLRVCFKTSSIEYQGISSCTKIGKTLVFADNNNKILTICKLDCTEIHHVRLSYIPSYITMVNSNTVAVSCGSYKTILIMNISTRTVTSTINTSGICFGISYEDNNLYVVIDNSVIHVMDLTGTTTRTILLPSGDIFNITVDRDRLVYIDSVTSIHCCSLDGTELWMFKRDKFQDLRRVTTDNDGNVYVTDSKTNTVVVITGDGKNYREILTETDGFHQPYGIYFDKQENILLVCNIYHGMAFLFNMIK